MFVIYGLMALYGLSWAILFGAFILMFLVPLFQIPLPIEATMVTVMCAFLYIAVYFVVRGVVRMCGFGQPGLPPAQEPVVGRRVILEEIVLTEGPQHDQQRAVKNVTPSPERNGDAR